MAFVCVFAVPVSIRAQDRAAIVAQARAMLDSKNWTESEKLYSKAIALDPKEWSAWTNRAFVRNELMNYDGAISDSSSGMAALALLGTGSARNRSIGFSNRSSYWLKKNEFRRALIDSVVACTLDETHTSAWLNRADATYALGDLKNAEICLANMRNAKGNATRTFTEEGARQNALKNKPIDEKAVLDPVFQTAYKAQKEGKTAEALAGYNGVIELNPFIGGAWSNRGVMNAQTSRFTEAIWDYSTAISLAGYGKQLGDMARNLTNRAFIYIRQTRFAEAVTDLELALKTKPDYQLATDTLKTAQEKLASVPSEALPVLERVQLYLANAKKFKGSILEPNTDADAALSLIDQFNRDEPANGMGWYWRGLVEEQVKSYLLFRISSAFPFYDKAIALDPKIGDAYYRRGKIVVGNYSFSEADRKRCENDYDKAIELGIVRADLFDERAKKRLSSKDYAGARADLNKALELEPKNEAYLSDRARVLEAMKLWKEALADRTSLLETNPNSLAYVSRGEIYLELKDRAKAIADFDRAVELSPEDADYRIDRAKAYRILGEKSKALRDYHKARALDEDYPVVLDNLSNAGEAEKLRIDTKHLFKKFADSTKKASDAILKSTLRKKVLNDRIKRILDGDDRKPADILKEVGEHIASGIADGEDYYDRAFVYYGDNKFDLAIADTTKALAFKLDEDATPESKKQDDIHRAEWFDLRGLSQAKQSKFKEGLADFEAAAKANPEKGEYPFHMGIAYSKLDRYDESIAAFENALKIAPSLKQAKSYLSIAYDLRGILHEGKKEWALSLSDYQSASKTDPQNENFPFHEGNAYFNLKKYDEAISAYDRSLKLKPDFKDAKENRALAMKKK